MSTRHNENSLDDNKLDFELMTRRRRPSSAGGSQSTSSSELTGEPDDMIWPLHLNPTFISHYITGEVIGHGSYAEVRECVDIRNLERCAVKIINKKYLMRQAPQALANQLQEIRLLRHLKHAHIVSMKECLNHDSNVYIVLEHCAFNLDELLRDQIGHKFDVSIGRRLFYQLCLAVNYLHSCGIVHRDIKPQNMLLSNCGCLKLIDFGVSHVLSMWDQSDLCSNYEGTPLFQAPEIVAGNNEYNGFGADVWSCGVTLFLLLYGRYPFDDEGLLGLYDKILAERLEIPDCVPTTTALADLFAMMFDKDCLKRANIEQVLAHPWMKLLGSPEDWDNIEFMEFFNLVTKRHDAGKKQPHSKLNDMYKSMTVLPYLYKHHFPDMPIRRLRRDNDHSDRSVIITKIHPLESSESSPSTNTDDMSDELADDQQVEWGTREQYNLLKVPQIRANRVRCGIAGKLKIRWRRSAS